MGIMSDAALANVRMQRSRLMQDTASVRRASNVSDGRGGYTQEWREICERVACTVSTPSSTGGGPSGEVTYPADVPTWTVHIPWDIDVRNADRLVWGDRTLEVVSVTVAGSLGVHKTLFTVEVDHGS